ncbi:AAA family ATPase [Desulfomonile tiedjei]|uniref:ATPase family protein associated with various cellular activities (AAA) n=1 Tax=Desulfomonile tiedjei (strain ATCC 49306 / DSM 6799 / DCB-1) TaxID=706587 RepID=I4C6L3_DESTA|nr:MoxR family ATPase [Desulfomonile tiedjei]AFM25204.1 ATPase family protein associated with various cellular activities (AAA) [Desulfomonile tiedjei DSM 6799]
MAEYLEKITIKGVEIHLMDPPELDVEWVGMQEPLTQLLAAWSDDGLDPPMQPRILGKPGVGKTSLAITAAKAMKQKLYITQCTVDTKPEDLIISPVIADNGKIRYVASPLVSAMVRGGICLLDEGNRMSEKSWASIAPLLDMRRSVYSIVAGVEITAKPEFRICVTMNEDASTFEVPEYIHSRLQPAIHMDFPTREEEYRILRGKLDGPSDELIREVVEMLQQSHARDEDLSVRDGLNIARYAYRLLKFKPDFDERKALDQSLTQITGETFGSLNGPKLV